MIGGDWAGLHYVASSFISFAIVVAFGYWLTVISTVSRAQWNHVRAAERAAQRSW
jgi:hypothetical protein